METAIQIFNNPEFGQIRTMQGENGQILFVGKDVAKALGYCDTSDALKRHVDSEDKLSLRITDTGQRRKTYLINESGLYSLILSSKLPHAKQFKHWVTAEVLPSIRMSGRYEVSHQPDTEQLPDRDMSRADTLLRRQVNAFNKRLREYTTDGRFFLGAAYGPACRQQEGIKLHPGIGFEEGLKSLFKQLDDAYLMFYSGNYGLARHEMAMQQRMELMRDQIVLLGKTAGVI